MRFFWLTLKSIVSAIVILLLLIWLAFKIPALQNWLAEKATAYLSDELGTKVSIEKIDIQLFDKIALKNFYLEDRNRDTLIHATEAVAYIDISNVLKGKFIITAIDLNGGLLQFHRLKGQKQYNLFAILEYFLPKNKKKKKKVPFELAINHINAKEVRFHLLDEVAGTEMSIYVPEAVLHSRKSNILGNMVELDSLYGKGTKVKIRVFPGTPLPDSMIKNTNNSFVRPNWKVVADKIIFENLDFHLLNEKMGVKPQLPLDFADLNLKNANFRAENLDLHDYKVTVSLKEFSAKEQRGFEIKSFYGDMMASSTRAYIRNFELQTPNSTIGNEIDFEYNKFPDFLNFIHKVKIRASLSNSIVSIKDIMSFAAPLNKIPFFVSNKEKMLMVDGYFEGKVDSFTVRDIVMNMNNTHLEGNMTLRPFEKYMSFEISDLHTNYKDLQSLLSFTKIPSEIANLGKISFYGDFNGYLDKGFSARGNLYSEIGQANLNLNMNPMGGLDKITYNGKMLLSDFNIAKLINNPEFGKVDAYLDVDGKGLTLEGLNTTLKEGRINYFDFRGYRYDTIFLQGNFEQKKFVGDIVSFDPHFNLSLLGGLDLNHDKPLLNLKGSIRHLDFCELKIISDDLIFSIADVDLRLSGFEADNFSGRLRMDNINFHRGWGDYHIDSIFIDTKDSIAADNDSYRTIRLRSDIASATIQGHYSVIELPKSIMAFAEKYYPNFVRNVSLATSDTIAFSEQSIFDPFHRFDTMPYQQMSIDMSIYDSKKLTEIIHPEFKYIKGAALNFYYDSRTEKFNLLTKIDSIKWAGFKIENELLNGNGQRNQLDFENIISHLQLNDSTMLPTPYLKLVGRGDSLTFNIKVKEINKFASNVNLNGGFRFSRESFTVRFNDSELRFFDTRWDVKGDNYINFNFADKKLKIHDLQFQDSAAVQRLAVYSFGEKGLQLNVDSIDIRSIYTPVKLPMFDIDGKINARVKIEDVFAQKNLTANLYFENLVINGDDWNRARLDVNSKGIKDSIYGKFSHFGPMVELISADFFFIPAFATDNIPDKNFVNVSFNARDAKAKILEYFMVGQLTNTLGFANAKGRIYGKAPKLNIEGLGTISNLETTFNFLNTRYYVDTAAIVLSNEGMIFSPALQFDGNAENVTQGIVLRDQEGNKGYIGGRILHKNLKQWGIDLDLVFNRNLTLNTTEDSNMPFYGKVWATGRANVSGLFTKMTMVIDAETKRGPRNEQSVLVLPIMKAVEVNQAIDFLVFKDMKVIEDSTPIKKIKTVSGGIEMLMKIKATPDAMARIIIDEQAGDVIEGSGTGDLQINYTPSGELFLYGDFEIETGNYLFTYRNIINKPFKVEKGGTIRWSGDPYNAEVNLKAKYVQKSRLYNLLLSYQEELQNSETRDAANKPVDVEVLMNMTGSLMRPDIKFGLNVVGTVEGRVSTLANLALRAIQQDENKLNRQVFGLIALNQFLPEENTAANLNLGSSSFNTLSEMVSQQFSRYLGDLLSEVVEGQNILSSIDVQFGYKMEDDQLSNTGTGSQFDLSIDNYFLEDKLRVHIGGNLDVNNSQGGTNQNYFGGDLIVEYSISENGNLKIKLYNRYENSIFGQRNRAGGGISYEFEFDSFEEMAVEIKRKVRESRENRIKKRLDKRKEEEDNSES